MDFPPSSKWTLDNPESCVAAAGILAFQKKYPEALAGLNLVGEKLDGIPRALAAEGVGDILLEMKQYQGSADAFRLGVNVLDYYKKTSDYLNEPDKTVDIIHSRIKNKLAKAEKLLDSEKYGPEFVAYRTAREHEFNGDFLRAVVFYERIIREYPDTVYSEAAELYGAKCLLRLSEKTEARNAEQTLANFATKTQETAMMLKKDADRISRRILAQIEAQTNEDESILNEMKKVSHSERMRQNAQLQNSKISFPKMNSDPN